MKTFLAYTVGSEGQKEISNLSYAPLPAALQQKARAAVDGLTCDGSPVV
jgi:hypothetical protein